MVRPANLALVAVGAQAADALTFMAMVSTHTMAAETNALVHAAGAPAALALKLLLMVYLAALSAVIGRRRPEVLAIVVGVGLMVGALGTISNVRVLFS